MVNKQCPKCRRTYSELENFCTKCGTRLEKEANKGEKMKFGEAIEELKSGKKVARRGWNGKNQYIQLASNISFVVPNGDIINGGHDTMGNSAIVFIGTSGVQVGWLASQADMLSEDWEIVE